MNRRGQITIFVIIAIVIVASIGTVVYIQSTKKVAESPEVKEVRTFTETCLKQTAKDAIFLVGEQGGYYNVPNISNNFTLFPKPYYIYETQNLVPQKEKVEEEIGKHIKENIDNCLNNFSEFKQKGIDVKKGKNNIYVKLIRKEVDIKVTTPITITWENSTNLISEFNTVVAPVRILDLLKASNEIATSETKDPQAICMTCIDEIAKKYDLDVSIIPTDERNDLIYIISDSQSNYAGIPYYWSFAAKYRFPHCTEAKGCLEALK